MRYAIIKNGVVENIAVADDPDFATEQGWVLASDETEIGDTYIDGMFNSPDPYIPTREEQEALRQAAYTAEADPIAMQMLRDEATKEEWLAKIEEIKLRYPYYD